MSTSQDTTSIELRSFITSYRSELPVSARVLEIDNSCSITHNHQIPCGSNIVVHGCTRQSKVLSKSARGDQYYAIPLTYQGKFRLSPKKYLGVSNLKNAYPGKLIKVTAVNSKNFPLVVGDIFRVCRDQNNGGESSEEKILRCESLISSSWKDVGLPFASHVSFEEVLDDYKTDDFTIKEIMKLVAGTDQDVVLSNRSPDQRDPEQDLPLGYPLMLCDHLIEPAVYVSINSPSAPAFHVPLRCSLFLGFARKLDSSVSPLITKVKPKLSTIDRCVERMSAKTFSSLRPHKPAETNNNTDALRSWSASEMHSASLPRPTRSREMSSFSEAFSASLPRPYKPKAEENDDWQARFYTDPANNTHKTAINGRNSPPTLVAQLEPPKETLYTIQKRSESEDAISKLYLSETCDEADDAVFRQNSSHSEVEPDSYKTYTYKRADSAADTVFSSEQEMRDSISSASPTSPASPVSPVSRTSIPLDTVVPPRAAPRRSTSVPDDGEPGLHSRAPSLHSLSALSIKSQPFSLPPSVQGQNAPAQVLHIPPGYALVPLNTGDTLPPGYGLVSTQQNASMSRRRQRPASHIGNYRGNDDESDDDDSDTASTVLTLTRHPKFKVDIPPDGNLYRFSVRKFCEFLRQLHMSEQTIHFCKKNRVDGKKFSTLQEDDLQRLGLLHPVVIHFRRLTQKKRRTSSVFTL